MDRAMIEAFVRSDYPSVVAAIAFSCGDRSRAEDAVQEVLASLLDSDLEVRSLRAWTVTAAMNRVRSSERRRSAERRAHDRLDVGTIAQSTVAPVDDEVLSALRQLPKRQREVLALHYLLDMAVDEVAEALAVSSGTVKTQLYRGREALRRHLAQEPKSPTRSAEEPDDAHR